MKRFTATFLITLVVLFAGCKKDSLVHKENITITLTTWYRVSPAAPSPVVVNNTPYVSLASLVVNGDGTATLLGNVKSYANTLSYSTAAAEAPMGAIGAPVKDIPGYPVTGAPLPLIQTGDFAEVPAVISRLNIPANIDGHTVNLVLFNADNDALFLSNISGSGTATPISATVGGYTNKVLVAGGAGKFKNATGELDNEGHFSLVTPYDGVDNYEGSISY